MTPVVAVPDMGSGLTDRDLRRIRKFVETPPRERTPTLLCPDDEEPEEG